MSSKAINHLSKDPLMARLIEQHGEIVLKPRRLSTFESLTRAIIHQQLSGKAAGTILGRFKALYTNKKFPSAKDVLNTPEEVLRSVGLSRAKTTYILDIAARTKSHKLPSCGACERFTNEELIQQLTAVKGVGQWTAEMLLIFNLGREDILPLDDAGVRKGFLLALARGSLPKTEELPEYGNRWKPYRSYASLYLWKEADL